MNTKKSYLKFRAVFLALIILCIVTIYSLSDEILANSNIISGDENTSLAIPVFRSIEEMDIFFLEATQELTRVEDLLIVKTDDNQYKLITTLDNLGISSFTRRLLQDNVDFNNMVLELKGSTSLVGIKITKKRFPALKALFSWATSKTKRENNISPMAYIPNPCGEFAYPVPSVAPYKSYSSSNNASSSLFSAGFHRTSGYACGASFTYSCAHDYTRSIYYYRSNYGQCNGYRFRDQGYVEPNSSNHTFFIQGGGEPNPELHTYSWPYYSWPSYVYWWHQSGPGK